MDHNNCIHCSLLGPQSWPKSITLETQQVHQYLNSHLGCTLRIRRIYHSQTLTDLPLTQSSLVDGSGELFSIEIVQKYEVSRRLVSCEKEQPLMTWKSVCDLGTIAILLDQPRLRSLNSGDAVLSQKWTLRMDYIPNWYILWEFSLSILWNCKPWWILDPCQKKLIFSWLIHVYHW
jgi:hypothetical protein